jgi:hypothetical protein
MKNLIFTGLTAAVFFQEVALEQWLTYSQPYPDVAVQDQCSVRAPVIGVASGDTYTLLYDIPGESVAKEWRLEVITGKSEVL